ncbi:MAG: hypothetical protein RSG07_06025, partial [Erysipelotrichaceae bacterium]
NRTKGNNVKYADDMEYLILSLLNKFKISKEERVGFSKNLLFSHCGLINENYRLVKGNTLKFSQMIDMPVQTINECFDYTNNRMLKTLQSALNRMQRQALITWSNGYNMVLVDDKGQEYLEIATIEDEKAIMSIERNIMLKIGYTNKRLIFTGGQWNSFKEKATNQLKSIYPNIKYYYDNISFNYNNEDVTKVLNEYETIDKKQVKQEVNSKFSKSLDGTIDRRHKKAKEKTPFGKSFETIENYRKSNVFPQEQKEIKDIIINNNSEKVVLNKDYDKTKVKYLQKTFFEKYNPINMEQLNFNEVDIVEEENIPF